MTSASDPLFSFARWRRLVSFALVSLTGLALDTGLFLVEVHLLGVAPFAANCVSAGFGITFVYFVSVRKIFDYEGRWLFQLFAAYVAYQIFGVLAASAAVAWLIGQGALPLVAKLLILPVTFSCNYLFMRLLTRPWRAAVIGER